MLTEGPGPTVAHPGGGRPVPDRVGANEWAILAGLRFAFAAGVFSQHIASYAPNSVTRVLWALGGFPGVAGFLILSGFSIRASYESQPSGYLKRRVLRIFPVYLVAMGLAVLPFAVFGSEATTAEHPATPPTVGNWFGNLFMLTPLHPFPFPANLPLWTVQVEFLFYLLAPALVRAGTRVVWGLLMVSAAVYALVPHLHGRESPQGYGIPPLLLLWIWLLGWQLYGLRRNLVAVAVLLVATAGLFGNWQGDSRFGVARMTPPLLAITALATTPYLPEVGRRMRALMNWLGDLSYEIYAFHVPVMTFLCSWNRTSSTLLYAIFVGAVSAVILHAVDRPIRRLGRAARR